MAWGVTETVPPSVLVIPETVGVGVAPGAALELLLADGWTLRADGRPVNDPPRITRTWSAATELLAVAVTPKSFAIAAALPDAPAP